MTKSGCFKSWLTVVLASCALDAAASAQCAQWSGGFELPGVDDQVYALEAFDDGSGPGLYVAGSFHSAGQTPAHLFARWNGTSWSAVGQPLDGLIHALQAFDDGTGLALYVTGRFENIGGVAAKNIAKWNGSTWSALGSGLTGGAVDGEGNALTVFDDGSGPALFVGGNFDLAGGVSAARIAKWDGTSFSALGTGIAGSVLAFGSYDDGSGAALYVGGKYTTAGGITANDIARWDGSSWSSLGSGLTSSTSWVNSIATYDDGSGLALYVTGRFYEVDGFPIGRIARWDGSAWSAVGGQGPDANNALVYGKDLEVFDDGSGAALYLGGKFNDVAGLPAVNVARWDGAWSAVDIGLGRASNDSTFATALETFDDGVNGAKLIAGGTWHDADHQAANNLAQFDGSGWSALGSASGVTSDVFALLVDEGAFSGSRALYAGGDFLTAGEADASHVARWDGSAWSTLAGGVDDRVHDFAFFDDGSGLALYVAGDFVFAGGAFVNHVAKWDGVAWSALGFGLSSSAMALAVFDDGSGPALYAGGVFTNASGVAANRIAKWNGSSWSNLAGGVSGPGGAPRVDDLAVFDDGSGAALYAVGSFQFANGVPAGRIAKWDGSQWSAVGGTGLSNHAFALAAFDDGEGPALFVAGDFITANGISAKRVVRWDGSTWTPLGDGLDGVVNALASYDDGSGAGAELYATGIFAASNGTDLSGIAKWNGAQWLPLAGGLGSLSPGVDNDGNALAVFDDGLGAGPALYVGGDFDDVDGSRPSNNLARWSNPCACQGSSYCTAGTTTNGCQALIASTGFASRSQVAGFDLAVSGVEGQKQALLFFGYASTATHWGAGSSFVCVAPPTQRLALQSSGGTAGACDGSLGLDFNAWMQANPLVAPAASSQVYLQAWFRDPPAPKGTNLSDALQFVVCP